MIVKTYNGLEVEKDTCKYIRGEYYVKNVDCFQLDDGKWYRINSDKIVYDYSTEKYIRKNNTLIEGVVLEESEGAFILGYFTPKELDNIKICFISEGLKKVSIAINKDIFKSKVIKSTKSDLYYIGMEVNEKTYQQLEHYSFSLAYQANTLLSHFTEVFENEHASKTQLPDKYITKYLSDKSFGIEYETRNGRLHETDCLKYGLIPVKDGSLRHNGVEPYEYATIILNTPYKIKMIPQHCALLRESCDKSINESLHVHIGGIPQTKEYVVSLYIILLEIQEELYNLFPNNVRQTSLYKSGGKDYCKPLSGLSFNSSKGIDYNFGLILENIIFSNNSRLRSPRSNPLFQNFVQESDGTRPPEPESINWQEAPPPEPINWELLEMQSRDVMQAINDANQNTITQLNDIRNAGGNVTLNTNRPKEFKTTEDYINYIVSLSKSFRFSDVNPNDRNSDHKWNIASRYKIVNFNPILFGENKTIEFRCHPNTFNENKIIYWVFIINAICTYANLRKDMISTNLKSNVSLYDIISTIYTKDVVLVQALKDFIKNKKSYIQLISNFFSDQNGILDSFTDAMPNNNFINLYE